MAALDVMYNCLICSEKFKIMVSLQEILNQSENSSVADVLENLQFLQFLKIPDNEIHHRKVCFICVARVQYCFEFKTMCGQVEKRLRKKFESADPLSTENSISFPVPYVKDEENLDHIEQDTNEEEFFQYSEDIPNTSDQPNFPLIEISNEPYPIVLSNREDRLQNNRERPRKFRKRRRQDMEVFEKLATYSSTNETSPEAYKCRLRDRKRISKNSNTNTNVVHPPTKYSNRTITRESNKLARKELQRQRNRERQRKLRDRQRELEYEEMRKKQALLKRLRRERETPEETQKRRLRDAERKRQLRAAQRDNESKEEALARKARMAEQVRLSRAKRREIMLLKTQKSPNEYYSPLHEHSPFDRKFIEQCRLLNML